MHLVAGTAVVNAILNDLVTHLCEEVEQHRRLLLLTRKERGAIVRGALRDLEEAVQAKERLAQELGRLEKCRARILAELARAAGVSAADLTLVRAVGLASGETANTLSGLLVEFRNTVGRLVAANEMNRTLLDRSLDLVNGSLALFRTVLTPGTYGAAGRPDGRPALAGVNQTA